MTTDGRIQIDREAHVATITLCDPGRRNALDLALADALTARIHELDADADVHALVLTGAPPAFSAGADLDVLLAIAGLPDDAPGDAQRRAQLERLYAPFLALRGCRKPTLAAVGGAAVGAGLNLVLATDLALATPDALFMAGFDRLGLHPGGGMTAMLQARVGPQVSAAMLLFGERVDGKEAARCGLVHRTVPAPELLVLARALALRAAAAVPAISQRCKATLRAPFVGFEDALAAELAAQAESTRHPDTRARLAAAAAARAAKKT